ncbi:hypothetical protein L227DRAFT_614862 [Lentinus tigrinus ALCF2SS1-6]|uniref:Uncharacterized protein n=1 Tax=Lentinus tigrinus ALCF2SS1-6 TaxID=1328759 RepID=A0A5C2RYC9_9APHY|nr:hypothetical protein L227DRAFT_614862 [Lentinus tigrinus ALCF2SS1-6]
MASWVLAHPPWQSLSRFRLRFDALVRVGGMTSKQFLNTPTLSMDMETPMMKEMKAYPYPSVSPDASLFEEPDESYIQAAGSAEEYAASSPLDRNRTLPCYTLERLALDGKYEDADHVHAELVEHGVRIRPHAVYHFIARKVLSADNIPSQARVDAFVKWWSLVPSKEKWDCTRSVGFILTETLRKDAIPDIPLIARFALLAASKGYASQVSADVINILARFAPPSFTIQFLEQFCVTTWNYATSLPDYKKSPQRAAKDLLEVQFPAWYSSAVRTFASTGDFTPAMAALRVACSRKLFVTQGTYIHLLRRLELAKETKHIKTLESLWEERARVVGVELDTALPVVTIREIPVPAHDDVAAVAASARQLKQALRDRSPVAARNLAALLGVFLDIGRLNLVRRIRSLAYRSGYSAISTWALAEMIYYQAFGRKSLSAFLSVFEHHFYLVGVPQIIFDPVLISEHRLRIPPLHKPKGNLYLLGPPPTLRRRLQPSLYHTYMLWRTVVHGVRRPATLVRLYRSFFEQVAASRRIHVSPALLPPLLSHKRVFARPAPSRPSADAEYMKPIPPHSVYDVRFFNIFITMFARFQFWPYLTRVIIDLHRLGFHRDDGTQNAFMQQLRLSRDMQSVHRLLNYWEDTVDRACKELKNTQWKDEPTEHSTEPVVEKPDPETMKRYILTFFYLATIRRLVLDGRTDHAREVIERFTQAVPGRKSDRRAVRAVKNAMKEVEASSMTSAAKDASSGYENPELDTELGVVPLYQ